MLLLGGGAEWHSKPSTMNHQQSTIILTQISQPLGRWPKGKANLTKDALLRAHRPPGGLLFQPQITRISQIVASRDALARRLAANKHLSELLNS